MHTDSPLRRTATAFALLAAALLIAALLLPACAKAQSWGSATGLIQGEHLARATTVYDAVLRARSDTTAWIPVGTHTAALAAERPYAPTRFTLFARLDTAGVAHAAAPSVTLRAQVALGDTAFAYEQADGSLELVDALNPLTSIAAGRSLPVPLYGGGWVRFLVTSADTARVRLDLWRVR